MQPHVALLEGEVRPLKRVEYDRLVDLGVFEGEKVELLYGRIVQMAPQGEHHSSAIVALTMLLVPRLAGRADVRVQLPLACPDESEPEPDVAIVPPGSVFLGDHPSWAHLVIEVAASSQEKDRGPKGDLYARAGVPEYWVVDVRSRRVERYRRPVDGRYAESSLHESAETLCPGEFPDVEVELARILPPPRR